LLTHHAQLPVGAPENLVGVAADDGRVLWQAKRKGSIAVIPDPIVAGERIYVSSGYGTGCNLFRVSGSGSFSIEQEYANEVMVNHHGGVVKVGDNIYGLFREKFHHLRGRHALLPRGSRQGKDGQRHSGAAGSHAVWVEGKRTFRSPKPKRPEQFADPVIAGGKLYLRDQEVLLCYDVKAK